MRRYAFIAGFFVFSLVLCSDIHAAGVVRIPPRVPNTPEVAIQRELQAGSITKEDAALYDALDLFKPGDLPDRFKTGVAPQRRSCGTGRLLRVLKNWDILSDQGRNAVPSYLRPSPNRARNLVRKGSLAKGAAGPILAAKTPVPDPSDAPGYNRTMTTTNFLLHWNSSGPNVLIQNEDNNSNGIPDMIEACAVGLETTWTWFIDQGYRLPPDTDTSYYNVYFTDIGGGALAYCEALDWPADHSASFIVMGNDYSGDVRPNGVPIAPVDELRCVASHEFFHAVQFAYDLMEDTWWMEACSTWVMDQIGPQWDSADVYANWAAGYLYFPEISLDADYWSPHWYMDVLWAVFLQEHVDADGSIIREIWEAAEGPTNALNANKQVLAGYLPGGFAEAWRSFIVANYEQDYADAAIYPLAFGNLWYAGTHYTYPTGTRVPDYPPEGLGTNYVRFFPPSSGGLDLIASFSAAVSPSGWTGFIVGKRSSGGFDKQSAASGALGTLLSFCIDYDEAVLIVSPMIEGDTYGLPYNFTYFGYLTTSDVTAPAPNPLTWSVPPHATGSGAISMTATTATDSQSPPVSYRFYELSGNPGADGSAWQASPVYEDDGLSPNTQCSYAVQARDSASSPNAGMQSVTRSAYTLCNVPAAPVLSDPSPTKIYISISDSDGNPSDAQYAVRNVTSANYVQADGSGGATAFFTTRAGWSSIRIKNLANSTSYTFAVKAKNGDAVETAFSPSASLSTLPSDTQPPTVSGITVLPTWIKEGLTSSAAIIAAAADRSTGGSDIKAAEYYFAAEGDPGQGSAHAMRASDGAFDSPIESVVVNVNTSTWHIADNPYEFYIRSKDEVGFWSAPVLGSIDVVDGIPPTKVTDLAVTVMPWTGEEPVAFTVSSVSSEDPANPAADAVDSDADTYWASLPSLDSSREELVLAFDKTCIAASVTLLPSARLDLFPSRFRVQVGDGVDWYTVVSEYDYHVAGPGPNEWQFEPRVASSLRIIVDDPPVDSGSGLRSVEIAELRLARDLSGRHLVDLTWTSPTDVGPTGKAASYVVKYSTEFAPLSSAFGGVEVSDPAPDPSAPGLTEEMAVSNLAPNTPYYLAVKSIDSYDNFSQISNVVSATTLPDDNPYVALDAPQDLSYFDVNVPPTFVWHANLLDTFKIEMSNVPSFPARPYKDADGRLARTLSFSPAKGESTFTPADSQWKTMKALASAMDGTLYWRVAATSSANRALGVVHSKVSCQYGFDGGVFSNVFIGPHHDRLAAEAVWPNGRPQFVWSVSNPLYAGFWVEFSASPDISPANKKATLSLLSPNLSRTWFRPTPAQWKTIKKRFVNVAGGLIYWRVRGVDADKVFSAASAPVAMLIDSPGFELRKPAPRRDGTVMPGEVFTLDWGIDGEGYDRFEIQVSTTADFLKGPGTASLKKLAVLTYTLTPANVNKIQSMLTKAATDTFYWRVIATDLDGTFSVPSPPQSVKVSVEPAGGS